MAGHFLSEEQTTNNGDLPPGILQNDVDQASQASGMGGHFLSEGEPPKVDPVKQATSASTAAASDDSWFSEEFRSGALFKEVLGPVGNAAVQAAKTVYGLLPNEEEARKRLSIGTGAPIPQTFEQSPYGQLPPHVRQAVSETLNEPPIPKEIIAKASPLYWAGWYNRMAARALNPKGPPAIQAVRTGLEATGGFLTKGSEAVAGLVTPMNALLAVAPELLPARLAGLANKGLALYFLKEAMGATPEQIRRFNESKDPAEKAGIVAETMVSYAPAGAFYGRGKALRGRRGAEEQPSSEPVGTSEVPGSAFEGITQDQLRDIAQTRLNDLAAKEGELTPGEQLEVKDLQEGLAEGGDINTLAAKLSVELSDAPAAEGEAAAAPAATHEPGTPAEQVTMDTARFGGEATERIPRADFIKILETERDRLNAKSPLSATDVADLTEINAVLDAAEQGQATRLDQLAKKKYGVELSEAEVPKGGEESAVKPSDVKVQAPAAAQRDKEGATGEEPGAGSGDNVIGKTEGEAAGGAVPPEAGAEPVAKAELTPEELADLSVSQREHYEETGVVLPPEEAAKLRSVKVRAAVQPTLPDDLAKAVTAAEKSATRGSKDAKAKLEKAQRVLAGLKDLSKDALDSVFMRLARVENAIKGTVPSTAETADPRVVEYSGNTYIRTDEIDGVGVWHKAGPGQGRLVGNPVTRAHLDTVWQARQAIAEAAKEDAAKDKGKKAAPKTESTAASVPTTRETPSREEIGEGEAQPAPGTKVKHWTWGEGEVVGPGKKPNHTLIRFQDGSEMQFDNKVVNGKMMPKAEAPKAEAPGATTASVPIMMTKKMEADLKARGMSQADINKLTPAEAWDILNKPAEAPKAEAPPAKPDPAAKLKAEITELRDRMLQDKTTLASGMDATGKKLSAKEIVALKRQQSKDKVALSKLLKKENKLPEAERTVASKFAAMERDVANRAAMRKLLEDRVKKEKFPKKDVQIPSSTGGEPAVIPGFSYRGLRIYKKPVGKIKPWRIDHEQSGKPIGNFETEADAKAFALRIHDGTRFDFTRPWEQVLQQKKGYGTAKFQEMVVDPYSWLDDAGARIRDNIDKDKTQGGFMLNEDIGPDIMQFGRRLYDRGMAFRDWSVNMVKHLGQKIIQHLNDIWNSITGRNLLPGRGERGGASPGGGSLQGQNKKPVPGSGAAMYKPIVTKSGAIIQPKYNPAAAQAPARVNAATGGTIKPPPPGSALGPTPPGSNPHQVWYQRVWKDWRRAWEGYQPGAYASIRLEPKTVVVNTHQRWLAGPANGIWNALRSPWYAKVQKLTDVQLIDAEYDARTKYQTLRAAGQGELQATLNAIKGNPLRDYFIHRMNEMVKEKAAAKILNVKVPGFIDGPYLPRLTRHENKSLIRIGASREGVVTQLRRSLGHFDASRKYETMREGINNKVDYRNHMEAIIQRERVGEQLKATAQALKDLQDGKVIYRKRADAEAYAKATYKPHQVDVTKMEGFGGDDWYVRNRQEARVIDQNLNNSGPNGQWGTFMRAMNNYARNPNLWNPAPHVTKNMFFKYALARINNLSLKPDTAGFKRMTKAQLIDLYHQHFTMPGAKPGSATASVLPFRPGWLEHSERVPEMVMGESKRWFDKATHIAGGLNRPSQKFIFEKADPYLRYKLWESYFRKGMHPGEAANNVFFDLIRYDENSGGLNLMKSIPGNFFSTWRVGTYVTMYKAMKTHPIRTLMFFGAVEYLREMIYRRTGNWTHLPIDYLFGPMAEVVESAFRAKRETALGRSPTKAYGMAAKDVGMILLTTGIMGPGGSQAPTTIKDAMGALQGDDIAFQRMQSMFWGLSQLFNIPQEFLAYQRDKKPEHLVNILTGAAFGTHTAISYEPRRMGKHLFPESLPGMAYSPEMKRYAQLREKAEGTAIKAATTHERRYGQFRWVDNSARETQIEQLLRRAGVLKEKRQGAPPPVSSQRGGGY